jgi:replicative DNA helicase
MDSEIILYDTDLEELAILSLLKGPEQVRDFLLGTTKTDMFYIPHWREVYVRIKTLVKERNKLPNDIDILHDPVITSEIKSALKASAFYLGEQPVITDLDSCRSATEKLVDYQKKRKLHEFHSSLGETLIKGAFDTKSVVQSLSDKLSALNTNNDDFISSILKVTDKEESGKLIDKILSSRDNIYIPTGFAKFDAINKGLPRGGLTLVAASTGGGKSLTALHMAKTQAEAGLRVCLVSLEMDDFELMERRFSSVTGLTLTSLKNILNLTKREKERARETFLKYQDRLLEVGGCEDYKCKMNNLTIEELLYGLKPFNYDVIIIDYLGLLKGFGGEDQWRKMSEAARFCKVFAADNNIQVIALAQVDKEGELRYSKGMLEHANNAFSWVMTKKGRESGIVEIEQKKARMAEAFPFYIKMNFSTMTISEVSDDEGKQHLYAKEGENKGDAKYVSRRTSFFKD